MPSLSTSLSLTQSGVLVGEGEPGNVLTAAKVGRPEVSFRRLREVRATFGMTSGKKEQIYCIFPDNFALSNNVI